MTSSAPEAAGGGDDRGVSAGDTPDTPDLSLVVGRALGTVVVTVDGQLNADGCQLLERLLSDLIEGQGNLAVAVDLGRALVEPDALGVFVESARRARLRGTKFILKAPPKDTHDALHAGGYCELVEVLPRPGRPI